MKKHITKIALSALLLGGGYLAGSTIPTLANSFNSEQPGSANDPLVTKSYVDEQIGVLIEEQLAGLDLSTVGTGSSSSLEVVKLQPGQALYPNAGAEVIVRTGKTVALSDSSNGLADVTAAKDILNGEAIENNHLLINPGEGRGLKPHESVDYTIYVMVRGGYTIQ
ncbi:hypothetical protein [Chengkuizengella axinellae]|uniref:WxL domain-containing protein n=1 Tax=Chengkuizengella axinellae TaxID=3064388 RepID=A0ABT9J6R6_9BACL|nr:hypothetical protein [Chengkuizengella sp. 2205SS18-9]MDP5276705.1 hypothetical protein [Chengkuizengella sp. 2205SS18-9]